MHKLWILAIAGWAGCGPGGATVDETSAASAADDALHVAPIHVLRPPASKSLSTHAAAAAPATIDYHDSGGSCSPRTGGCPGWIERGVTLYFIWYGNWSGSAAPTVLPDWASNVGDEPWYDTVTAYWDAWGNYVPSGVGYWGGTNDWYSQGTTLSDASVPRIVAKAIHDGSLPLDPWGLYFVFTSSDVTHTGSVCSTACGWHSWTDVDNQFIKYSIVPDMNSCPNVCPTYDTPNDPSADAMVNVMGHELAETVTDPLLTAWWGNDGTQSEIGDLCAWDFGGWFTLNDGTAANVWMGDRYYLMQQLFHLDDSRGPQGPWQVNGHCALAANGASAWQ